MTQKKLKYKKPQFKLKKVELGSFMLKGRSQDSLNGLINLSSPLLAHECWSSSLSDCVGSGACYCSD